jgi:hypothetical protein
MESMTPTTPDTTEPPPPDFSAPLPPAPAPAPPTPAPAWSPEPNEGEVRTDRNTGVSYAYHDGKWDAVELPAVEADELLNQGDEPGSREHIGYATVRDQSGRQVVVATFGPAV